MQYKLIHGDPKTYVLAFETGDELFSGLSKVGAELPLAGATFTAIGGLSSVRLGWLNWQIKKYQPSVTLDEQVELLSLIGNVVTYDGKPWVHAHAVVGRSDGTAHGGHLLEAHVRPTCEMFLTESPERLRKKMSPEAGIPLLKLS